MPTRTFRGIRPDDLHGRRALLNPERGFRTEMYASCIPGEIAGMCSVHFKELKLDGRDTKPRYYNRLIRGNRLDGVEFRHCQWQDELDFVRYDGVSMMQSYVYLMKFSNGRALTDEKLRDIDEFLNEVRRYGAKTLLRFAYELRPRTIGPDRATILRHLEQLTPLLRKHSDVIYVLQCGFIGVFGEWHSSLHHLEDDVGFHRELFRAVLAALPADRMTMVRYPRLKRRVFGDVPVNAQTAFSGEAAARIGHFNDGFLAGETCGGTFPTAPFSNPGNPDFDLIVAEGRYLPVDGELFWNNIQGEVEPLKAALRFRLHYYNTFGFVHGNSLFQGEPYSMDLWRAIPADPGALQDNAMPIADGYFLDAKGEPVLRSYYEYIRDHLGYRLELQRGELPDTVQAGGRLQCRLTLMNRGFSTLTNPRPVFLTLAASDGRRVAIPFDADPRRWYPFEPESFTPITHPLALDAALPAAVTPGRYTVGLWLPDAAESIRNRPEYAVRFANDLEWRDGINVIGALDVV